MEQSLIGLVQIEPLRTGTNILGEVSIGGIHLTSKNIQTLVFIIKALNDGWTVRKTGTNYTFSKSHGGQTEVYSEKYLEDFLTSASDLETMQI